MSKRVAIAGFLHETNTFAPSRAAYGNFEQGGGYLPMSRGAEITHRCSGVNLAISGFVDYAKRAGWELVPLLWTGAIPSAHVERDAYERIAGEIADRLRAAGEIDGLLLDLHGAMVAEHLDDGEGELLKRLRAIVGPQIPISASLDLHGNVTRDMVDAADILVAFRTYPHVDMAETGLRAAEQLDRLMARGRPFAKAFRQLPFLIPIPWQCTTIEPSRSLYAQIERVEGGNVSSASILTGFPAADFEDCRPSILAYAGTQGEADAAADALERAFLEREGSFAGKAYAPLEAIAEAERIAVSVTRPVIIADTQDNPGAGGDSNTTGMLRALLEKDVRNAAIGLIVDPASAARAHAAGEGADIELALGGQSGIPGDAPFKATYHVDRLSDGRFKATGPYYGGADMNLGPSACLTIDGVRIVVSTYKAQMADREMYRFVGIEPEDQAILVNKSSVHFRADFEPIAEAVLVATAPGPMALDPADLPFTRLKPGLRLSPNGPAFQPAEAARRAG
ncbi:M81 family metallopeptidase [Mesorhizobium sp. YIM 152430]|uniref:M81 family metallopeptidase n=1 Tax=Mesorhizobium sp. YIM 152430 TaxID=3031761 RepID=UPI0023DCD821|nr:M81 family metallopeptidase [Mesorhizobium sp. YIM 152430]MDF1601518.1 M81 family metallopeptidase [Mesorhizobium sp. YIM 152430]